MPIYYLRMYMKNINSMGPSENVCTESFLKHTRTQNTPYDDQKGSYNLICRNVFFQFLITKV